MRTDDNGGSAPNYYPNTQGRTAPDSKADDPPREAFGPFDRHEYYHPNSDFEQAGLLYRKVMTKTDRDHLIGNIMAHLGNAQKRFQLHQAAIFFKADEDYGKRIAEGLKRDLNKVKKLAAMTREERVQETLK